MGYTECDGDRRRITATPLTLIVDWMPVKSSSGMAIGVSPLA